jgi:tetratricopeptide (TPR) repeat protein
MTRRMMTPMAMGAAALVIGGLLPSVPATQAAPPQEPAQERGPARVEPPVPIPPPDEASDPDFNIKDYVFTTDQAIQFFETRVKKNSADFTSLGYLAAFYERKAKEVGDLAYFAKAEEALRKSLELFPGAPRTEANLAAVLCSQHKFAEALRIARKLHEQNPRDTDALATMGDALLEMGQYPEAEETFQKLYRLAPIPQVIARLANLAELKGDTDEALRLMRDAAEATRKTKDPKAVAWYLARQGDIVFNAGRISEAEQSYQSVPQGTDAYHDATFGLGRVRAAQGRYDEAIALGEKAVAIGPDPHMLAALGDLYLKTGQEAKAEAVFDRLERVTQGHAAYLRERSLFYANHDRKLPEALALAEEDLVQRKDVYGYDALAWALSKNDRPEEAAHAIKEAMKLGTQDAKLFYHAGMIYRRLGDAAKAREYLERALARNPHFSLLQGEEARRILADRVGDPESPADSKEK